MRTMVFIVLVIGTSRETGPLGGRPPPGPGPALADFLGLPIDEAGRQFALSWDSSRYTLPEHHCPVHTIGYIYRGPLRLRIWEEGDPMSQELIAIRQYIGTYGQSRTIWMDGRAHPSGNAPHMGFSTGEWVGDSLRVRTMRIWHRRNGLPSSDRMELARHGDVTHAPSPHKAEPGGTGANWLWRIGGIGRV